ncbi:MAG: hypothetical protein F6K28_54130 [Microcoleus sp. SIO2G3]|nr:hypothetical protein [Microcoleus sp. SIO2G3]
MPLVATHTAEFSDRTPAPLLLARHQPQQKEHLYSKRKSSIRQVEKIYSDSFLSQLSEWVQQVEPSIADGVLRLNYPSNSPLSKFYPQAISQSR